MNDGEGPAPQPIRCGAGHILGMQVGAVAVMKHDRRTYVGVLFTAHCKCGSSWTNPTLRRQVRNALDGLRLAFDTADLPEPDEEEAAPDK